MATSPKAFLIELYEEYLEEASFLYEQRLTLFHNPDVTWKKIGEFEERLEAHIDGLVVGDKLALEICARQAAEGDFGELFASICVFCRQDRRDLVLAEFDRLDPGDAEKASAVADALKYELPEAWIADFLMLLDRGDPKLAPILARAMGYRRLQCGPELLRAMKRCAAPALAELIWAVGRVGYKPASESLFDYLGSEDEPVRSASASALARMGELSAVGYCVERAGSKCWPLLSLGIAGGREALAVLTKVAEKGGSADCLIAVGLLGDSASIPVLVSQLAKDDMAPAAAMSLQCITGAGLQETVFVPDEIDEDELFDSEREELKEGKTPGRGDGRPFGSKVTRLCRDPEVWQMWWTSNADRFSTGMRYRNGRPFCPAVLVDMLAGERTPYLLRKFCLDELAVRYAYDARFEIDSTVIHQVAALAKAKDWSCSSGKQFQEGAFYFAGHVQG